MPDSRVVFLDTSGWIALLNSDDDLHAAATESLAELARQAAVLVTTDWVVAETGNGLARSACRIRFVQAVERFLNSPSARLVRIDSDLFRQTMSLYEKVSDKTWGMVDCASFVVMRGAGIVEALSADRHFEQAGYHCLL